jgi:hypothetical protein
MLQEPKPLQKKQATYYENANPYMIPAYLYLYLSGYLAISNVLPKP